MMAGFYGAIFDHSVLVYLVQPFPVCFLVLLRGAKKKKNKKTKAASRTRLRATARWTCEEIVVLSLQKSGKLEGKMIIRRVVLQKARGVQRHSCAPTQQTLH